MPLHKVCLYAMNKKGLMTLQRLIDGFDRGTLAYVVTSRDTQVVRDYCDDIMNLCRQEDIDCYLRADAPKMADTVALAIGWRWMLPASDKLIIFHDSLLPRYRGFAPLVASLINGETTLGVTALFGAADFDTGNIISQASVKVSYPLKISDAIDMVAELYSHLAVQIVSSLLQGIQINSNPQQESEATYSVWRDANDYRINWHQTATQIHRFIDAVGAPYKGAAAQVGESLIRIFNADIIPDVIVENRCPGKLLFLRQGCPVVICEQGLLCLRDIRTSDGDVSRLPWTSFRTRFL